MDGKQGKSNGWYCYKNSKYYVTKLSFLVTNRMIERYPRNLQKCGHTIILLSEFCN